MAVRDPTKWYGWLLPDVGGDIGSWDTILNRVFGEDNADADGDPPAGIDEVLGLLETDLDTLKTDIDSVLDRITTLEANTPTAFGARIELSSGQSVPIATETKLNLASVDFDQGSCTGTSAAITVPSGGAGIWQVRAQVQGSRYANVDDGRYWTLVLKKNGSTSLAQAKVPYINDGVESASSTVAVGLTYLDADAVEGDYYEAYVTHGDDDNDSGSSTVAADEGTYLQAVRMVQEDPRTYAISVAFTADNTAATNHNITMPSKDRANGDILLMAYAHRGTGAITTPTGWTLVSGSNNDDGTCSGSVYYKRITTGEAGGDTVNVVKVGTNSVAAVVFLLRGMDQTNNPEATAADVSGGSADPPSITPSWGATKTLFLAISSPSEEESVTDAPTNYDVTAPAGITGTGSEQGIDAGMRIGKQTSEDPGAFSYATSVGGGITWTVAIEVA